MCQGENWGVVLLLIGGPGGIPGTGEHIARLFPFEVIALYAGPAVACLLLTGLVSGRAGYRSARPGSTLAHRWRAGGLSH